MTGPLNVPCKRQDGAHADRCGNRALECRQVWEYSVVMQTGVGIECYNVLKLMLRLCISHKSGLNKFSSIEVCILLLEDA